MKKILLLVVLLISTVSIAQINSQITNYQVCDDNNDGIATFNLTSKVPEILNNLNPAIHTTTFHETLTSAQTGFGAITNTSTYVNVNSSSQTIYVRVVNTQTSEISFTSFQIVVNPRPIANPASLFFCDPFELVIYSPNQSIPQIVNGQTNLTVTFYLTQADAEGNVVQAQIPGNFFVPTVVPVQILFARVQNNTTGCFSITTLTLNTNNCTPPNCTAPINLTVSSITNTSVVMAWTSPGAGPLSHILVLPFGSPVPTASTTGWVYSQTNPYVFTGLSPDSCYTVYVRSFCSNANAVVSPWSAPTNFCMYNCSNNAQCLENLELIAFVDSNNNGTKEVGEMNFSEGSFVYSINSGTPIYASSNNGNFYIFENNPLNTYNLSFAVNAGLGSYFSTSSVYSNVTVPTGSGSTTYYFPITQLQAYNDLETYIVPYNNPRPGFTYTNTIFYKNKGLQTVNSGTVTFTNSPTVSITNISQSGTLTTPTGFSYTFSNLLPNETRSITVTLQVPTIPTVSLGQIVTNAVSIEPISGDAVPDNNSASLSQTIVGSYDPNDKMEAHGGRIDIDDFSSTDYLTYTIRFENTGTASAEFIRVEDTLNAALNASSVVILNASHPVDVRRINNKLIWNFHNINLPPTITSPTLSHGYVRFKVKPNSGYAIGDIIPNGAEIYFDYNPPIFTNNFQTEFVQSLGITDFTTPNFILFPNPTDAVFQVNLQNSNENIQQVLITDLLGKTVKSIKNIDSNETTVAVADLAKGLYLVEITTESNLKMTKKLVIK
ncbi:MAG: T9SS type A sorting domain-containing protein [Bacteroidota bacterium]